MGTNRLLISATDIPDHPEKALQFWPPEPRVAGSHPAACALAEATPPERVEGAARDRYRDRGFLRPLPIMATGAERNRRGTDRLGALLYTERSGDQAGAKSSADAPLNASSNVRVGRI